MKSGFYKTISDDQFSSWTKKFQSTSENQTCTIHTHTHTHTHTRTQRSWSLFGGLLTVWSTTAFWIPVKALHVRSMLSKLMRWIESCNACKPAVVNRMGHILLQYNAWPHVAQLMLQKLKELGYNVLLQLPYSPNLSPTDYHSFKHLDNFLQQKCLHNHQKVLRVCWIPKHEFLRYRNKQAYFSLAKMCWI